MKTKLEYIRLIRTKLGMANNALERGDEVRAIELQEEALNVFNELKQALNAWNEDATREYKRCA